MFNLFKKVSYPKMALNNHKYSAQVADVIYKALKKYGEFKYFLVYISDDNKLIDSDSGFESSRYPRKSVLYKPTDKDVKIRNLLNAEIRDKIFTAEIDSAKDFYRLDVNYRDGVLYCTSTIVVNAIRQEINKTLEEVCQTF